MGAVNSTSISDTELDEIIASISGMSGRTGNPATNAAGFDLGMNMGTLNLGLSGLGTIGNLWGGFQANKLAKDQLRFTKEITNTNLNNQIKSYNTSLEDRIRSRAAVEGQSAAQANDYLARNKLTR